MPENYTADQIVGFMQKHWPEMSSRTHRILVYLSRVRELSFSRARAGMDAARLSPGEFDILATLRRSPQPRVLSPTELQRSLLITSGGLTKLLYQLEDRDLVSRSVQAGDRRCKLVHLTDRGKRTIEAAMAEVMAVEEQWLEQALTSAELDRLNALLRKAAAAMESGGKTCPGPAGQR